MQKLLVVIQVERRVVNQLAAEHEQELISSGCTLHLTVSRPKDKTGRNSEEVAPTIKLQHIEEGKKKVNIAGCEIAPNTGANEIKFSLWQPNFSLGRLNPELECLIITLPLLKI